MLHQEIEVAEVIEHINEKYQKDLSDIVDVLAKIAPVQSSATGGLQYIHKPVCEFYIAKSIIEESLAAKL